MVSWCDKCGGSIIQGNCPCGIWIDIGDQPKFMQQMHDLTRAYSFAVDQGILGEIISGDLPDGECIIMFKGDYGMCMKAREFIETLQDDSSNVLGEEK